MLPVLRRLIPVGLLVLAGCRILSQASPPPRPPAAVMLAAVGDLVLDRGVGEKIQLSGFDYPFAEVAGALCAADITFGNLECPLTDGGSPTPGKSEESLSAKRNFLFRAPPGCAEGLAGAGFDVVIGGAGLIGSHTVDLLTKEDVGEIVIYDNFVRGIHENLAGALRDPRVKIFEIGGDIGSMHDLRQ